MSQENVGPVEVVREHIEAYRRDDVPGALSHLDADIIVDTTRIAGSVGAVSHGHDGLIHEVRRFMGAFEDYDFEVERMTDLGAGTVAVVVNEHGRGKGSGIAVARSFVGLYSVLDGKIVRITGFPTERDALEATGLSE
jgi:ketosteroid isomerase-like protein